MNPYPPYYQMPNQPPQRPKPMGISDILKVIFVIVVLLMWLVALGCPAYDDGTKGATCFIFGWSMGFTNFAAFLAWLGNLPFFIAYFMYAFSERKIMTIIASVFAGVAFLASFGAFSVSEIMQNEGGGSINVSIDYGAFIWIGSMFLLVTGTVLKLVLPSENKEPQIPVQNFQQYPPPNYPPYPQQYPPQNYPPNNPYPPQNYPPQQNNPPQNNPYPPQQNIPPQNNPSEYNNPFEPNNPQDDSRKGMGDNL
jgi:hypothetical protein